MHIATLNLFQFKNYPEAKFSFEQQVNCLTGPNGSGKTNLLDAVHYLCMTKSAFAATEQQNVEHGADFFTLMGQVYMGEEKHTLRAGYQAGMKKTFSVDRQEYDRLSAHIGRFPCVLISPDDTNLVREGSELRRRYVDSLLSQLNGQYLEALIRYHRALRQRNVLLKRFAEQGRRDLALLEAYDAQLCQAAPLIFEQRQAFIAEFVPLFVQQYAHLSLAREAPSLRYRSELHEATLPELLATSLEKDLHLQRTTAGLHRDDFVFGLGGYPLKKYGSQGQQKSFVIALKLAQHQQLAQQKGFAPLLLLDDIFDKLDEDRIGRLLTSFHGADVGQVMLTDARPERTRALLQAAGLAFHNILLGEPSAAG